MSRRYFLAGAAGSAILLGIDGKALLAEAANGPVNLAPVAVASSNILASENRIGALKDGLEPKSSFERRHGLFAIRPWDRQEGQAVWIEYQWPVAISIASVELYWAVDKPAPKVMPGAGGDARLAVPASYRILAWNGKAWEPVAHPQGLGLSVDGFNQTAFDAVKTDRIRVEIVPAEGKSAGLLKWRVFHAGPVPELPPLIQAGLDHSVVTGGPTYLAGSALWLQEKPANAVAWRKVSGPGTVTFANAAQAVTTATFSAVGDYVLALEEKGAKGAAHATVEVHVEPAPPEHRLDVVYTTKYTLDSPFWGPRAKSLIVEWIPYCIRMCERTDIAADKGDGGIDNFIEAAKANRGEAHAAHKGYVFSNAWVHQTVESICIALMVDAEGDAEILAAQQQMRQTLERWIPIILAAQMPDGYLQTAYSLSERKNWPERWSADHRGNHEGYVAGYFIESAINHYTLTDGKDLRLYNGAKKLADCWVANIGPGRKEWFDGHQEMEQALVRFGRFVNDQEGDHKGDAYIQLGKFLLDSRRGGSEYDQSHLPPGQQYEAVGHAVRATYFYSGMSDIAAETRDHDYQSAVLSLWDNMVNRKYYLTGGIGSGETSEGFGPNYSLGNDAYNESCSSCGLIFFQYKLNLAYHDAKYADLYEQTMYNALLGSIDLKGKSFCYTNPLVNTERARWHVCPCCVGNIPRTLLMTPTWSYVKSAEGVYVNLFIGSRIKVGQIAGTEVEMVQQTNYPWEGKVRITVNPEKAARFAVYVRIPNRATSKLYHATPAVSGLKHFAVNGEALTPRIEKGYAVVERKWKAGDHIELELPMNVQRVTADERVKADRGAVALQYGPLVYNVETDDNGSIDRKLGDAPLTAVWRPDLLGGVMTLVGKWQDGAPLTAIPHYARMNRVGEPAEYPGPDLDLRIVKNIRSKVWI